MNRLLAWLTAVLLLASCETPLRSAQAGMAGYRCDDSLWIYVATWPSGKYKVYVSVKKDSTEEVSYQDYLRQHPTAIIKFNPKTDELTFNGKKCDWRSFEH